jgi:hypothetical protein
MGDISVTIDAHQFRFFDVELVSNLHMMGFLHLLCRDRFVAAKTIAIDSFIRKKKTGEQLTGFCMTIHTCDTSRMDRRG